jgi:hypothetical protein
MVYSSWGPKVWTVALLAYSWFGAVGSKCACVNDLLADLGTLVTGATLKEMLSVQEKYFLECVPLS